MSLFVLLCRAVKQLYCNLEEIVLLKDMGYKVNGLSPKGCFEKVRIRYPFNVDHPKNIDIGNGTEFGRGTRLNIYLPSDKGLPISHIIIGKNCWFGNRVSIFAEADVVIGDFVLTADDVTIDAGNHGINPELDAPYMDQELVRKAVKIGNNVWLGEKSMVCAGASIGDGCIIGAGAVVTKNIPNYSVAVGIPAKVIKTYNFSTHKWEKQMSE